MFIPDIQYFKFCEYFFFGDDKLKSITEFVSHLKRLRIEFIEKSPTAF